MDSPVARRKAAARESARQLRERSQLSRSPKSQQLDKAKSVSSISQASRKSVETGSSNGPRSPFRAKKNSLSISPPRSPAKSTPKKQSVLKWDDDMAEEAQDEPEHGPLVRSKAVPELLTPSTACSPSQMLCSVERRVQELSLSSTLQPPSMFSNMAVQLSTFVDVPQSPVNSVAYEPQDRFYGYSPSVESSQPTTPQSLQLQEAEALFTPPARKLESAQVMTKDAMKGRSMSALHSRESHGVPDRLRPSSNQVFQRLYNLGKRHDSSESAPDRRSYNQEALASRSARRSAPGTTRPQSTRFSKWQINGMFPRGPGPVCQEEFSVSEMAVQTDTPRDSTPADATHNYPLILPMHMLHGFQLPNGSTLSTVLFNRLSFSPPRTPLLSGGTSPVTYQSVIQQKVESQKKQQDHQLDVNEGTITSITRKRYRLEWVLQDEEEPSCETPVKTSAKPSLSWRDATKPSLLWSDKFESYSQGPTTAAHSPSRTVAASSEDRSSSSSFT